MDEISKKSEKTTKSIEKTHKVFKNLVDLIQDGSKKSSRAIEHLEKRYENLNKTLSKSPQYFKNIEKLALKFQDVDDSTKELEESLRKLGVNSSVQLSKINNQANETVKSFNNVLNVTKQFSRAQTVFTALPDKLKQIQKGMTKGFDSSEIKDFMNSVSDLESVLGPDKFETLKGSLEKGIDPSNIQKYSGILQEMANTHLKEIRDNFRDLESEGAFKNLDKESSEFIDNLLKMNKPIQSIDDLQNILSQIDSVQPSINQSFERFTSGNDTKLKNMSSELNSIADSAQEVYKLFERSSIINLNVENIKADADDMISHIKQKTGDLHLFPEETLDFIQDVQDKQQNLVKENKMLLAINTRLDKLGDKDVKMKQNLLNIQSKVNERIQRQAREMKEVVDLADASLDAAEQMDFQKWGHEETKKMAVSIFKAYHGVRQFSDYVRNVSPKVAEQIDTIAQKFKLAGKNAAKFRFGAALISGAYKATKAIAALEEQTASMYQSIQDSGLLVARATDDIRGSMGDLRSSVNNVMGLTRAVAEMEGSFTLGRKEILDTISTLDRAGLAAKNLENQMKQGVMPSISGTTDELVGAATMVRTFSTNLGIADVEITNLMGNMAHDFNSTMGTLKDGFTDISVAIQNSSMSTTRFLGMLGTTTAGLSIYAEQVSDTAREIERLSKSAALTGKDVENLIKGSIESVQDVDQLANQMAVLLEGEGKDKFLIGMEDKAAELLKKQTEALERGDTQAASQFEDQHRAVQGIIEGISSGTSEGLLDAATLMNQAGTESIMDLRLAMLKQLDEQTSHLGAYGKMQVASQLGMGELMQQYLVRGDKLIEAMEGTGETTEKSFEDLQKTASEMDKLTQESINKLTGAVRDEVAGRLAEHTPLLKGIAAALGGGGLLSVLGNLGSAISGFTSIATLFKGGKVAGAATKAGSMVLGAGSKLASGIGLGGLKAGAAGAAKMALPLATAGAAGYGVGTLLDKGITKLGGGRSLGERFADWRSPSDEEIFKKAEEQMQENIRKAREARKIEAPSSIDPVHTTEVRKAPTYEEVAKAKDKLETKKSVEMPVNIYVNGNDEERMKRVIVDVIQDLNRKVS